MISVTPIQVQSVLLLRCLLTRIGSSMANKPMARVPKMARGMHCCPIILCLLTDLRLYIVKNTCVYTHTWLSSDSIWATVATKWYNTASEHFYTNRECCEVLTGYLLLGRRPGGDWPNTWHWTKRLQSSFQTGSRSSPSYFHIFFLIAFLEEVFIRNLI